MNSIQRKASVRLAVKRIASAFTRLTLLALFAGIALTAQAQTVTTIFDFSNVPGTSLPVGPLAQGRDGQYYGITYYGTVFKVTASGTYNQVATMTSMQGQVCNGLILATDGNFYGTCEQGGDKSTGTFFQVTPTGTVTVLHNFDGTFSGTVDGCYPLGVPVQASDGNFYGTTLECGVNDAGIIYKITPAGVFTAVHAFAYGSDDGNQPQGALIQGSDGNLWGTLSFGGANNGGAVFKSSLTGSESLVFSFGSCPSTTTGCNPLAGLMQGSDGNYYGTAEVGGANNQGVAFKLTPRGTYTVLHSFDVTTDNGASPVEPVTQGTDGILYGVATDCLGGGCSPADLFQVTTKGVFTDVYNFPFLGGNNNSDPRSPVLLSTTGTFYGTTFQGGSAAAGTVYSFANGQSAFIALQQLSGKEGNSVNILGQGFSSSSVVKFGGVAATKKQVTGSTFLQAQVPAGALTGKITVTTGSTTLSSIATFKVTPKITTFSPTSGTVGTPVTITGSGFIQATAVGFNRTAATFTVNSDTQISTTVPTGATTGKITVTTKGGSGASTTNFTVN